MKKALTIIAPLVFVINLLVMGYSILTAPNYYPPVENHVSTLEHTIEWLKSDSERLYEHGAQTFIQQAQNTVEAFKDREGMMEQEYRSLFIFSLVNTVVIGILCFAVPSPVFNKRKLKPNKPVDHISEVQ